MLREADDVEAVLHSPRRRMTGSGRVDEFLEFEVDAQRYGIRATDVIEVLRAVTMVELPNAPRIVAGVVTVRGVVVPVLNLRTRFGLPPRRAELADQLIVAWAGERRIALPVDRAVDLVRVRPRDIEDAARLVPGMAHVAGMAKLPDGLMLIHDLRTFLSRAEADALAALEPEPATP
jgi:purine-binding chemotaxis protein CheW